jgi:hypothetical protein
LTGIKSIRSKEYATAKVYQTILVNNLNQGDHPMQALRNKLMTSVSIFAILFFMGELKAAGFTTGFDSDADGWVLNGAGTLSWVATGGNPDGYLTLSFGSAFVPQAGSFVAGAGASGGAFTGNLSSYTDITFDFRTDVTPLALSLVIEGAINSWVYNFNVGALTTDSWQNLSASLNDDTLENWSSPDIGNSYSAFVQDMSNVSELKITGVVGPITPVEMGLDNVSIVPEPGSLGLLMVGLLGARMLRRKSPAASTAI